MYDTVKRLCEENGTSVWAIERELGLGNGSIRRWDTNSPSVDKASKVAARFGVSIEYLINPEIAEKNPVFTTKDGIDKELVNLLVRVLPEYKSEVVAFVQGLLAKHKE